MGYEVHIERTDGTLIDLGDWTNSVEDIEHVRRNDASPIIANPATGERFSSSQQHGNADIFDLENQVWISGFRWFEGRVSTRASHDFDSFESHQRSVMRALAMSLNARIVGDEGEVYD